MKLHLLVVAILAVTAFPLIGMAQNPAGPKVGSRVKDFSLVDQFGKQQKLSELLTDKPVALVVLRSVGWSTHCKDQLVQLQSELKSIEASGLKVVGLSYDKAQVLKDFTSFERYRVAYPLTILIDRDSTVAAVVKGRDQATLPKAQQLIDAWTAVKPVEVKEEKSKSFVRVSKNQFVTDDGKRITFKGVAIAAPSKVVKDGRWNKEHFETIKSWGANLVRIPVHPARLRKHGRENYLKLLDDAVRWCSELEMYVIIDWHSIGNLRTKKFEAAEYITSERETLEFWDTISKRFAGNPTVAFYEIFNEPTIYNGSSGAKLGTCSWAQWKAWLVVSIGPTIYARLRRLPSTDQESRMSRIRIR